MDAGTQPVLTESEWDLVRELLECEGKNLPHQIHHTTTATVRKELRRKLEDVEQLLERLAPSAQHRTAGS